MAQRFSVFERRDTLELWRAAIGAKPERPESEELREACTEPPPTLDALQTQLHELIATYRKLVAAPVHTERRVRVRPVRTEPPKRPPTRTRPKLVEASKTARPRPRRRDATPAEPPETDRPKKEVSPEVQLERAPRRAMNPFPQLSPFLPESKNPPATPLPKPPPSTEPDAAYATGYKRGYLAATASSRRRLADTAPAATPLHKTDRPPKSTTYRKPPTPQSSAVKPPPPPLSMTASSTNNPFADILAGGLTPPLPVRKKRSSRRAA